MITVNINDILPGLEFQRIDPPKITDETIFHVGISGGKDSQTALLYTLEWASANGIAKDRIDASFCDTGNEHNWTLGHVEWISKNIHPVKTVYPELDYFQLALSKKRFPSTQVRFCTEYLKIYPTQDHIQSLKLSGRPVIAVSGVRGDESDERAKLPEWDYSGSLFCYQWRPLIRWTYPDVVEYNKVRGVPLNPLYAVGAQRVGCWPCIMSRKDELRTIALKFPERIEQIRTMEQEFEKRFGRYSSFFARDKVPERFRTKKFVTQQGEEMMIATIDDVVRWALTGEGAKGSWEDDAEKIITPACNSGFCE